MLLHNYKWGCSVSKIALTPEFMVVTEERRLHPNPRIFDHGEDSHWNKLSNIADGASPYSHIVPVGLVLR